MNETATRVEERGWRRWGRKVLLWAIVLQWIGAVAFIALLFVGERTQPSLLALYAPRQPFLVVAFAALLLVPFTRTKRRRILLVLQSALCAALLFPVLGFSVSMPREAKQPIRITSYNVFFGKEGRPALLDEIAAMSSDIIVLQAAYDSLGSALRERLPDRTIHQDYELVLVTRFNLRSADVPPPLPDGTPAMYVKYVLDTPYGALRVYNVHAYSPRHALFDRDGNQTASNIAQREAQIAAVVAAARSDVPPFVIVGDTNLPGWSRIGREHFDGLRDAFDEAGFGFGYTFPAKRPWLRIDRALRGDGARFVDARVGARGASDHRRLDVVLELAGEP